MAKIPFYRHDLGQPELDAIADVFRGPILTTGDTVARFEERFAAYLGRRRALGTTSCTGALHMSLLALGIGPGDEVITTPMTFVATVLAVLAAGARPVFVDVEPDTGNLDADRVGRAVTSRTKAILPVHLYGLMCDMRALRAVADRHGLFIVEDCAHCVEGSRDGVRPGELADMACFSFYATKNLTCGEGGAIASDREDLVETLKLLRLHGMTHTAADREREGYRHWDVVLPGWKYNMDNIQAAMLLPQMDRLAAKLAERHRLSQRYAELLAAVPEVVLPATRAATVHARHLFPVWVPVDRRDAIVGRLNAQDIGAVVNYRPVHLLEHFAHTFDYTRGDFPIAERIGDCTLSLPFYPGMSENDLVAVAAALQAAIEGEGSIPL